MPMRPPRCPLCDGEVPVNRVYGWLNVNRLGLLSGPTGVVCPGCGAKLRVLQTRAIVAIPVVWISAIYLALIGRNYNLGDAARNVSAILVGCACVALPFYLAPRLARLRVLGVDEKAEFPLGRTESAEEPPESIEADAPSDASPPWTCSKCHEENEGNFEICWKCQAERPS
jgi:hypothetical protein